MARELSKAKNRTPQTKKQQSVTAKQMKPILGVAAAVGIALGSFGFVATEVPAVEQAMSSIVVAAPEVTVDDPHEVLTPAERQQLIDDARTINAPDYVQHFHYMVFENNHENILDTVEDYTRDNYPDLIDQSKGENGQFAEGVVIIGVGLNPRQAFAYSGFDIGDELGLTNESHLEDVLDAMKPDVKAGDIPAGLMKSAHLALDAENVAQYQHDNAVGDRVGGTLAGLLGGFGLATGVGVAVAAARNKRRDQLTQAREDYELVTGEYLRLAQRLDEVDIRAHSLTSAFADAELRKQWAEVRDRFLDLNDAVHGAQGLSTIDINSDEAARAHRKQLADAAETVRHTSNAEDNIDRLFAVENGDAAARRADLAALREDLQEARTKVQEIKWESNKTKKAIRKAPDTLALPAAESTVTGAPSTTDPSALTPTELRAELERDLDALDGHIIALQRDPSSPTFIDDFVRILGDYRLVLEYIRHVGFTDVKEREKLENPAIYDDRFWYPNYITYYHLDSWHASNVAAAQAASASSSSGFSAAGGSSSF
ncbi:DUF5129 domain-containing protein [Corynebacterium aquatimens]|uniref:DUF5129 domain-containing protein n=1 Tax=Corynebacterium TaxID=1716 RepID=UPI001F2AFEFF|nr:MULTISPECIES: DUF5129 domain-containing protein [Corynebacterium]QYH19022.1 DUF5129 domain-containing protein [Corynebacterium aquatimens]UIZ92124.1 DUF5129 domain-containing protein [Corynebacterium sp. CNCTC7651]